MAAQPATQLNLTLPVTTGIRIADPGGFFRWAHDRVEERASLRRPDGTSLDKALSGTLMKAIAEATQHDESALAVAARAVLPGKKLSAASLFRAAAALAREAASDGGPSDIPHGLLTSAPEAGTPAAAPGDSDLARVSRAIEDINMTLESSTTSPTVAEMLRPKLQQLLQEKDALLSAAVAPVAQPSPTIAREITEMRKEMEELRRQLALDRGPRPVSSREAAAEKRAAPPAGPVINVDEVASHRDKRERRAAEVVNEATGYATIDSMLMHKRLPGKYLALVRTGAFVDFADVARDDDTAGGVKKMAISVGEAGTAVLSEEKAIRHRELPDAAFRLIFRQWTQAMVEAHPPCESQLLAYEMYILQLGLLPGNGAQRYDRKVRKEAANAAAIGVPFAWGTPSTSLLAQLGLNRQSPCLQCGSETHQSKDCVAQRSSVRKDSGSQAQVCIRFNRGTCTHTAATCRFRHVCASCGSPGHPSTSCKAAAKRVKPQKPFRPSLPSIQHAVESVADAGTPEAGDRAVGPEYTIATTRPPPWVSRPGWDPQGLWYQPPEPRDSGKGVWTHPVALTTSLNADIIERLLSDHPNRALAEFVVDGARHGFRLNSTLDVGRAGVAANNLSSAKDRPETVKKWLDKEVQAGRIHRVDNVPPGCTANPLGAVPKDKRMQTDAFRIIHHYSFDAQHFPEGGSVNSHIDKVQHSLVYMSVLDFAAEVHRRGGGVFFAKADVRNAFRNLGTHRSAHRFAYIVVDGQVYLDAALSFGSRASPKIFESVAAALHWVVQQRCDLELGAGAIAVFHLLDDFAVVASDRDSAERAFAILHACMHDFGLPFAVEKDTAPCQAMQFLGVIVDAQRQCLALPADKKADIDRCIDAILAGQTIPTVRLQSATGKLQFATLAALQMRPVMSTLYRASHTGRRYTRLPEEARRDLRAWKSVLRTATETPISWFFLDPRRPFEATWAGDSAGRMGFGAFCVEGPEGGLFHHEWPSQSWTMDDATSSSSSTAQELVPLAAIVVEWCGPGDAISYETDSADLVAVFRKGRSRVPRINKLVRIILTTAAERRADVRVIWRPRSDANQHLADCLSRGDVQGFRSEAPPSLSQAARLRISDSTLTRLFLEH